MTRKLVSPSEKRADRERKLNNRITEIDALRGIAIALVILDHLMYDVFFLMPNIFGFSSYNAGFWADFASLARSYWRWDVRNYVRRFVLFIFLALTGVSCSFSRSNSKRALKLGAIALILTAITVVADVIANLHGRFVIVFGILHVMALSLFVVAIVERFTEEKFAYLVIGALLVFAGAIFYNPFAVTPQQFVVWEKFPTQFLEAFIGTKLLGPDSYSFLFYGGQVFIGVFLGKLLYPERRSIVFKKGYIRGPLTFFGRHSLVVYIAHQIIIPVVLGVLLLASGYNLKF